MNELNRRLFYWINGWPDSLAPTMRFFSEATDYGWVKVILGLFVLAMLVAGPKTRKAIVQTLLAVGLANTVTNVFKEGFPMHRPFQELPNVVTWVGKSDSMGTASAHSANMAAVAFVLCYYFGWRGSPWAAIALMTGLSRSYVGVHYPSQVLMGWTAGVVGALVVIKTWESFVRLRTGVKDKEPTNGTGTA